jgi:hypothetical protein
VRDAACCPREDICLIAEDDVAADRGSLRAVMRAAAAVATNGTLDGLDGALRDVRIDFAEPMLNSRAAAADFAV